MGVFTKIIIGVVIAIIAITGIIVGIIIFTSQSSLPPAQTPTPTSTTSTTGSSTTSSGVTSSGTTTESTTTGSTTTGSSTPGTTTGTTSGVSPTEGGVADGIVTAICGGDEDSSGIGSIDGACDRCENLSGTDGLCDPFSDEVVQVIGCEDDEGVECLQDDGALVLDLVDGEVEVSDYFDVACTIQFNVIEDLDPADNTNPDPEIFPYDYTDEDLVLDYLVYVQDDCSDVEFPEESIGGPIPADGGTGTTTGTDTTGGGSGIIIGSILTCGLSCSTDSDCSTGEVCTGSGVCALTQCENATGVEECSQDACTFTPANTNTGGTTGDVSQITISGSQCGEICNPIDPTTCGSDSNLACSPSGVCQDIRCAADSSVCDTTTLCITEASLASVTGQTDGLACGEACQLSTECSAGNSCVNGKCVSDFCAANPDKCDGNCQLPETALISDEADPIIFGALALILGAIALKTNAHIKLFYLFGGRNITAQFSEEEKRKLEAYRQQQEQERQENQIKQTKKSVNLDKFEDKILDSQNNKK